MSHRRGCAASRLQAVWVVVLALAVLSLFSTAGCFKSRQKDRERENVVGSAMDAGDVSLRDLGELRRDAEDNLAAASALATEATRAQLQDAQAEKARADAFFDQKAYKEAQRGYQNVIQKCSTIIQGGAP